MPSGLQQSERKLDIMRKQNEITQMLIKEQKHALLLSREIPVFKGDPLQFIIFIIAFEQCIEE